MKPTKYVRVTGFIAGVLLVGGWAHAAPPAWILQCDSENGCSYLSDGFGQESSANPNAVYPTTLDVRNLTITVSGEGDDKCTWQWKLINGRWQWVCLLGEAKK